jgi:hypothetical protein
MSLINAIDHAMKNAIYSIFWWLIDPLEHERLYGQLVDVIERNLDAHDPSRLVAPDRFDVLVNNTIFIKHAHAVKKLEVALGDRLQKYVVNKDYELGFPKIKIQIISSATVSKRRAQIRHWFTAEDDENAGGRAQTKYKLKVVSGEGEGMTWDILPGNTYHIGRVSTSDICLPFTNISKQQASLYFLADDKIKIVDEGSANGTFINDETEPIKGSRDLRLTDNIKLCKINPIMLTIIAES